MCAYSTTLSDTDAQPQPTSVASTVRCGFLDRLHATCRFFPARFRSKPFVKACLHRCGFLDHLHATCRFFPGRFSGKPFERACLHHLTTRSIHEGHGPRREPFEPAIRDVLLLGISRRMSWTVCAATPLFSFYCPSIFSVNANKCLVTNHSVLITSNAQGP